jgi:hypothetical protein
MSKVHDLPHGASIGLDDQILRIPVGEKLVLKFELDDFFRFYENIDDLKMILDFHTATTLYECQTCSGATTESSYVPPETEHEN